MVSGEIASNPLSRYVPRLLVEWLRDTPDTRHRVVSGTCLFADLSGYTAMTERLAAQGTAGAEETGEILNDIFEALLSAAYDFGAGLVKWGGDAVLLLFEGDDHALRATRAAWVMQNTIARVGKVTTSRGQMRVRMSIGVHSGDFHFMLVGKHFLDLVVAGPAMTMTARMEAVANAGEVVLSDGTARLLEPGATKPHPSEGHLLIEPPDAPLLPRHSALEIDVDLSGLFDPVLCDHLMSTRGDYEHRAVTAAFVIFEGTDALLDRQGPEALYAAVHEVVTRIQVDAADHGVVILATDLAADGGKALLVAGVPNKPGDDASRVLKAVTSIVASESPLTVRAGVTHGRVFAGDYGAPFRGTYSVAGDVINLAARLAYQAPSAEVLTTSEVIDRSDGSFFAAPLAPFSVKGKKEPIRAVSVARRPAAPEPTQLHLPLIGRDAELDALLAGEAAAVDGQGGVLDIVGAAGIGKSRLLAEYQSRAQIRLIRVDGDLYAPARPYASVQQLLHAALGLPKNSDSDSIAKALTETISARASQLTAWAPLLAIAAGTTVPTTPEVDALDATTRAERLRRVTSELLGALLNEPTVFIFNDTHAMDDASVALIRQLATDAKARPWSIVISRRPEASDAFPNSTPMALEALTDEAADALVVAASPVPIPAPRRAQLSERSGGNPLFLRALAETVAAGGNPDELPSEIEDVLTAHMDRLTPDERAWLRTASVLGTRVDPELLAEITDEPFDPATSARLGEYIRPEADGTLVFAHHLIQRTAYEAMPFRKRRTLHARASYAIERQASGDLESVAAVLAIHCLSGQRYDAAWQYARTAGKRARERYALAEAAASLDVALEAGAAIPGLPAREIATVAEDLALLRIELGHAEQTEKALTLARRKSRTDRRRLARLQLLTARQRHREGRYNDALRWISRARALLDSVEPDDISLLAQLAEFACVVHHSRGSYRQAFTWAEVAALEAQRCGDSQLMASAMSQLAVIKSQAGEPWQPVDLRGSESWDPAVVSEIINRLGMAAYYAGDLSRAEAHYAEAEERSRTAGHETKAAQYLANRAEVLVDTSRCEEAIPLLQQAIDELRATQASGYLPFALALLGRAQYQANQFETARAIFEEALRLASDLGDQEVQSESEAWLNHLARELGLSYQT